MAKRKSTKGQTTIYKTYTKDRVTRTPLKTGDELRWIISSCSTSGTRRVLDLHLAMTSQSYLHFLQLY
jgi:hypothetical protein